MARGKHAGKNNTFFGDENYYKRRNNNEESELEEDKEENTQEKSSYNNYSNNDYNYDEGKNFSDYDDEYEDENGINMKKVFIVIFIIAIIIFIVAFLYNKNQKNNDTSLNENSSNTTQAMSSQYEGYKVLGQLKIDKIGISQYILDSTDEDALKKGVCKIYGGSLNNYGNFCIVGHNYEEIFAKLSDLAEGDNITIIDKKMQETEYKISKIYSVDPDNLECLTQDESKVEITLITCKDGSTGRLVLKAEKIK